MSDVLDFAEGHLRHCFEHQLALVIHDQGGDPAVEGHLRDLGRIALAMEARAPGRFPTLAGVSAAISPLIAIRRVLAQYVTETMLEPPMPSYAFLAEMSGEILGQMAANGDPTDPPAGDPGPVVNGPEIGAGEPLTPTPPDPANSGGGPSTATPDPATTTASPTPAKWLFSVWLTKIVCVEETGGLGEDEILIFGNYTYRGGGGPLQPYSGDFDTGDEKVLARDLLPATATEEEKKELEEDGRLLAKVEVEPSADFEDFTVNPVMLEDDGLSENEAGMIAGLIGGVVSDGLTAAIASAALTGIPIPPQTKTAYEELGLPALVGVLADAFGPDPFLTKETQSQARIRLLPGNPANVPEWSAKIPHAGTGGPLGSYSGEGQHDGSVPFVEAETDTRTASTGQEVKILIGLLDGAKYQVDLRFLMERT